MVRVILGAALVRRMRVLYFVNRKYCSAHHQGTCNDRPECLSRVCERKYQFTNSRYRIVEGIQVFRGSDRVLRLSENLFLSLTCLQVISRSSAIRLLQFVGPGALLRVERPHMPPSICHRLRHPSSRD